MAVRNSPLDAAPAAPRLSPLAKGTLAGLAAVAMWALYLAFARAGVNAGLKPEDFVFLRYATAGAIMLPWVLRHDAAHLAGVGWGRGAVLALLAGPVFIFLGVGGYVFAPLTHGAVIQPSTITLGGMLAASVVLRERLTPHKLFGAAVIIAGLAAIASAEGGVAGPTAWVGDILFIGAGLLWVGFTLLLKHWKITGLQATAAVSILSAALVIPGYALLAGFERILALDPATLIVQIIVQGVFSGVLAVIAYGISVQTLGAARASLFPALVPAAALIVGVPVTGEMPVAVEWIGGAVASVGLMVAMGAIRFPRAKPPQPG